MTDRIVNELGRAIYVNPDDPRAQALTRSEGNVNPGSLDLWNALLEIGVGWDVAVDIGANYGEMLAGSRVTPAARVVAIEPNPAIASLLRRTCEELPFDVELVENVISHEEAGGIQFAIDTAWSGTSHIALGGETLDSGRFDIIEVPSTTLDALFPDALRAAVLKIDVEGAEMQVLQGAGHFFAASDRVAIMIEIIHMAIEDFWELQKGRHAYVWNSKTSRLVALDVRNASELGTLLHSGEYYRQDAVLLDGADVQAFDAELRARFGTTREANERRAAEARRKADENTRSLARLKEELAVRDRAIEDVRRELEASEQTIVRLNAHLEDRRQDLSDLEREVADQQRSIADQTEALARCRLSRAHRLAARYVAVSGAIRRRFRA